MRLFAWCLMALCAFMIGCSKPQETIPAVEPVSSGTTDADEHADHDHGDEDGEHGDHGEHAEGEHGEEGDADAGEEDSAAASQGESIRFVSNKSIKVPGMMCPYSCWPNVQKTLAGLPGVEGVQLAEQPEGTAEGEIKERVVELKINDSFDADAAVAALNEISFESEVIN